MLKTQGRASGTGVEAKHAYYTWKCGVRLKEDILTDSLKAWKEACEDVLAGIGRGQSPKLRNHNPVLFRVADVGVAAQESAAVGNLSLVDVEPMHQCHAIKPVSVTESKETLFFFF